MRHLAVPSVMFVLGLLVAQSMVIPVDAYIQRPTMTVLSFSPQSISVQLPMTTPQTVKFMTNISVYNPSNVHLTVDLQVQLLNTWNTLVVPDQLWFNSSGKQPVTVTVIVPNDITTDTQVDVTLDATGWYPNSTGNIYANEQGYIYVEQHHELEVKYQYIIKDQFTNKIEFTITNKGSGHDMVQMNAYSSPGDVEINYDSPMIYIDKGASGKFSVTFSYRGSSWPKSFVIPVRFYAGSYYHGYYVEVNVTISYQAPDRTQQNYLFIGAIGAFVIVMVVVLVVLMRGPSKPKKVS